MSQDAGGGTRTDSAEVERVSAKEIPRAVLEGQNSLRDEEEESSQQKDDPLQAQGKEAPPKTGDDTDVQEKEDEQNFSKTSPATRSSSHLEGSQIGPPPPSTPPLDHKQMDASKDHNERWFMDDALFDAYIRGSKDRNEKIREFVLQLKKPFSELPNHVPESADAQRNTKKGPPVGKGEKWYLNDELFAAYMHESKQDTKKLTEFVLEMKNVAYSMGLSVELRSLNED